MLEDRNFLMPDATFAIEMVAFLTVLVVMTRYVVPRIRERMETRERGIARALAAARQADRQRRTAEAAAARTIAEARREARQIVDQARLTADHLLDEVRRLGNEEYRWLAGRAERELERRSVLAQQQARQRARAAAVAAIRESVGGDVDPARVGQMTDSYFDVQRPSRDLHPAGTGVPHPAGAVVARPDRMVKEADRNAVDVPSDRK